MSAKTDLIEGLKDLRKTLTIVTEIDYREARKVEALAEAYAGEIRQRVRVVLDRSEVVAKDSGNSIEAAMKRDASLQVERQRAKESIADINGILAELEGAESSAETAA